MNELLLASHHAHDHDGAWFPFFPLLFIAVVVFAVVMFTRRWRHSQHQSGFAVLADRFARGEIDEAEYRERRAALRRKD